MKTITYVLFLFLLAISIISCSKEAQEKKEIAELIKNYNDRLASFVVDPTDFGLEDVIACYLNETDAIVDVYAKERYFLSRRLVGIAEIKTPITKTNQATVFGAVKPMPDISFDGIKIIGNGNKRGMAYTKEVCFEEATYHKYALSKQGKDLTWKIVSEEWSKEPCFEK